MITLAELFGERTVHPSHAVDLFVKWFEPDDIVVISGKTPILETNGGRARVQSVRITARQFVVEINKSESGLSKFQSLTNRTDLYFSVSPSVKDAQTSKRLVEKDTACVIGVTCDLDVKPGAFESQDQAMEYLAGLAVKPSFVVATGSGGLHAYWKFDRRVPTDEGKTLIHKWWTYLQKEAQDKYGVNVDRLVDVTRMLRVPGSLRYPKEEGQVVCGVTLIASSDRILAIEHLEVITKEAVIERQQVVKEVREKESTLAIVPVTEGMGKWGSFVAGGQIEEWVAERFSWDEILTPFGWTFLRTDNTGRDEWARPGQSEKSCVVNYPGSPNVMSLLSSSLDTNLADLLESQVALTKWRVVLRLFFEDDMEKATQWALNLMKESNE